MAQLMPLPLTVSCFSKIQIAFTFLVPAYPGSPGKRAVKWVCVCVCVCDTGLRSFVNGWITTSEERRAARHTAYTKPKTGPRQWCIAKNGGGYTQRGVAKGLKVPCLFMITEVSIRCQKKPEVGIRRIPAYTHQYATGPRCPQCSRVCASDFRLRSHMRSHDKTGNT